MNIDIIPDENEGISTPILKIRTSIGVIEIVNTKEGVYIVTPQTYVLESTNKPDWGRYKVVQIR